MQHHGHPKGSAWAEDVLIQVNENLKRGNITQFPSSLKYLSLRGPGFWNMSVSEECSAHLVIRAATMRVLGKKRPPEAVNLIRAAVITLYCNGQGVSLHELMCDLEVFLQKGSGLTALRLFASPPEASSDMPAPANMSQCLDSSRLPQYPLYCLTSLYVTAVDLDIVIPARLPLKQLCLTVGNVLGISFQDAGSSASRMTFVYIIYQGLKLDSERHLYDFQLALHLRGHQVRESCGTSDVGYKQALGTCIRTASTSGTEVYFKCYECRCCAQCLRLSDAFGV